MDVNYEPKATWTFSRNNQTWLKPYQPISLKFDKSKIITSQALSMYVSINCNDSSF
jgi:hypothetical protein